MAERGANLIPLAALGAPEETPLGSDLPLAYIPRIPEGATFREILERSAWGRR
jgi:hypothetical protein